jgi:stage V sporulation protein G
MRITKVEILPIHPKNGLMAFACIELDSLLYIGSIGVHKKLDGTGYRITYPTKKVGKQNITICHPINSKTSKEIEEAISQKTTELFGT